MRTIRQTYQTPEKHWVGNGFHVSPLFSHMGEDRRTSPFLMLDYAVPMHFEPNHGKPRGVGAHPHAGFETVTLALQGEVAHRDSAGNGGVIGSGDVQWMTAGKGIIHEEFHSEAFGRSGGMFEMLQFWVNLPKAHKNAPARYQSLKAADIPVISKGNCAQIRVIAGDFDGTKGAAETFSELNMWEIDIAAGGSLEIDIPAEHNLLLVALRGRLKINGSHTAEATELVGFEQEAGKVLLETESEAVKLVLLSGVPIDEPIAAYGPFVMNTQEEIIEKIHEFKAGKFGSLN
ncbi:MAG: pirin family protein [Neisseria sp.]|nr:pirin family protein [Neisseria sp.]